MKSSFSRRIQVQCTFDGHAEQILEILNDAIVSSTALYDYHPRAPESMVP
ncbi:MAG: Phosphinothricin N-acetyltransferase [Nitrospira sp.]|nr:Phosphinothricin N-acetyltransferase [Nitrospira sp.]